MGQQSTVDCAKPGLGGCFLSRPGFFFRSCMAKAVQNFPQVRSQKKGGNHVYIPNLKPFNRDNDH